MAEQAGNHKTINDTKERRLQKLTQEGYSNAFVDNVDLYECPFCYLVTRDAMQSSVCGHSFCSSCWIDWTRASGDTVRCPVDNQIVELSLVFKDRNRDRDIRGLRVYCNYQRDGCDATPEFRDLESHLGSCKYQPVPCELGCGGKVLPWSLNDHLKRECVMRIVVCDTCGAAVKAREQQTHMVMCPMRVVDCEYCQLENMYYKDLDRHSLALHHSTNSQQHLGLLNSSLTNLYSLVGAAPGLSRETMPLGGRYELPAPLWERVGKCDAKTMAFWLELPGDEASEGKRNMPCLWLRGWNSWEETIDN